MPPSLGQSVGLKRAALLAGIVLQWSFAYAKNACVAKGRHCCILMEQGGYPEA